MRANGLDQLIAVAWLVGDQLEQHEPEVALPEHAARPYAAPADAAAPLALRPAEGVTRVVWMVMKSMHIAPSQIYRYGRYI
jgi:hypothetical protein